MKKKYNLVGFILAVITGISLVTVLIVNAFAPKLILPKADANSIIILSLASLVIDYYFAKGRKHDFRFVPVYGAVVFGLFPLAAFYVTPIEALKLAIMGAVIFTLFTFLFDMIIDRLSTGPAAKLAPAVGAFGLYLASLCLMGII